MYVNWTFDRYALVNGVVSPTVTDTTTKFFDPSIKQSIGDGRDTFEFKVTNFNNNFDNFYNVGDRFDIYYDVDTTTKTSLIMNGTITAIPSEESFNSNFIRVSGNNYSETLMQALAFVSDKNITIDEYFKRAFNSSNVTNLNFPITWHPSNPSLNQDGVPFPVINETWNYKSILKLVEKYSRKEYTGDGFNYYFFIDNENRFVWRPRLSNPVSTFSDNVNNFKNLKTKRDKSRVINFVIAKGGRSPSNRPMTIYKQNSASTAKNGFKPFLDLSQATWSDDRVDEDRLSDAVNFPQGVSHPIGYPFSTSWNSLITETANASQNIPTMTTGASVSCANADEYDQAVFLNTRERLRQSAAAIIEDRKNGVLMIEIEFNPNDFAWGLGDAISITIPRIDKNNDVMRVSSVDYSTTAIRVTLEEDEGTV